MPPAPYSERVGDLVVLAFGIAVLLLASPLRVVWGQPYTGWWTPYAVWGAVIALGALVVRRWGRHAG